MSAHLRSLALHAGYCCPCGDPICFTPHTCGCGTPGCTKGCSALTVDEETTRVRDPFAEYFHAYEYEPRYWVLRGEPTYEGDEDGGNLYYAHDDLDEAHAMFLDAYEGGEDNVYLIDTYVAVPYGYAAKGFVVAEAHYLPDDT